jgi:hypothetical protein
MGTHDVVYVATENNSVYAFDAATKQAPLWHVNFNSPGITPVPAGDTNEGLIVPQIGITGTPAIDVASGTLYVVADTKITAGPSYERHLHALDLATGAEKLGGPVVVSGGVPGTAGDAVGGVVSISPLHGGQKAGLALSGGILYVPLAGHGDRWKYWHGWIFGYDAATLTQKFVWCSTPDANSGAIWQSAAGIPIDTAGNAFAETGNGTFDAMGGGGRDFGDTLVKVSATGTLVDWFAPHDAVALGNADADLGSAGPILLPDQTGAHPHLAIATGKPGYLYVVDRDAMGHFNAAGDTQIVQKIPVSSSVFATPAYFNGRVYVSAGGLKAFSVTAGQLSAAPISQSARQFTGPGAFLSVSSNGTTGGIVWALQGSTLYAFDATDLTNELYSATDAPGGRDAPGSGAKFVVPTVAGGHVYVGTQTELDVYGAL